MHHLEHDIGRHFDFEETQLFPPMVEAGDGDLATLLTEEHDSIRAVVEELTRWRARQPPGRWSRRLGRP